MRVPLILALAAGGSCIQPSSLGREARRVVAAPSEVAWRPARAEDLRGLYESISIEGEQATLLWKLYYYFAGDGTYTGAALVLGGPQPEFETLTGAWTLDERGLELGDGQAVRASAAEDLLRLEAEGGSAILRRVPIE